MSSPDNLIRWSTVDLMVAEWMLQREALAALFGAMRINSKILAGQFNWPGKSVIYPSDSQRALGAIFITDAGSATESFEVAYPLLYTALAGTRGLTHEQKRDVLPGILQSYLSGRGRSGAPFTVGEDQFGLSAQLKSQFERQGPLVANGRLTGLRFLPSWTLKDIPVQIGFRDLICATGAADYIFTGQARSQFQSPAL